MTFSLIKICKYNAYIYGAGKDIYAFVRFIREEGIEPNGVIDADNGKQGDDILGVKVMSPDDFITKKDNNAFVFVYTLCGGTLREMQILKVVHEAKAAGFFVVGGNRKWITAATTEWIDHDRLPYYLSHEKEIIDTLYLMDDEESLDTLVEYLRTYVEMARYKRDEIQTRYKYFYGNKKEEIYKHLDDENWLCFGACNGDTIFHYFALDLPVNKIFAIEGSSDFATKLKENMQLLPERLSKKVTLINKMVNMEDFSAGIFSSENVTLINADIEGAELDMLHLMTDMIKRCRPVIAVCLYHKKEDIVEIPSCIKSIVENYTFKLRKYTSWIGNTNRNQEIVLFAIPEERQVCK